MVGASYRCPATAALLGSPNACSDTCFAFLGPCAPTLRHPRRQDRLVLRSSKVINESSPSVAWGRWYAAPHPRAGAGIEPTGRHPGREGDLARVGEGLPGQRLTAEQPPPALLQVEPAGPLGDEGVLDAGMVGQPGPGRVAGVAGEVVGDHHDGPGRVGLLHQPEESLVVDAVARRCGHRHLVAVADAERAVDPGLLHATAVLQRCLDAMSVG